MRTNTSLIFGCHVDPGSGCGYSGLPQSGDVVSPAIVQGINWTAGKHGEIWAELSARDAQGIPDD